MTRTRCPPRGAMLCIQARALDNGIDGTTGAAVESGTAPAPQNGKIHSKYSFTGGIAYQIS